MYKELLKLKQIRGMTEQTKQRITKAWVWGLITDEEYQTLMDMKVNEDELIYMPPTEVL
jgi:hypothetical protein